MTIECIDIDPDSDWYSVSFEEYYPCIIHRVYIEDIIYCIVEKNKKNLIDIDSLQELLFADEEQVEERQSIKIDSLKITFVDSEIEHLLQILVGSRPVNIREKTFFFCPMISFFLILTEEQKNVVENCLFSLYNKMPK